MARRRLNRYCYRNAPTGQQEYRFKNLGLLIVDEEQKFGVGVKEKLGVKKQCGCAYPYRYTNSSYSSI